MSNIQDEWADRYAKIIAKKELKKISKIFYIAVRDAFKEGCMRSEGVKGFCKTECNYWNTEYRCEECRKNEFD